MKKFFAAVCLFGICLLAFAERPSWADNPKQYGESTYDENSGGGVSEYYYSVGTSTRIATESTARTRARQNIQADIAANIASEFTAQSDFAQASVFLDSEIEDPANLILTVISNSIKTRVPRYEILEWAVESGTEDGKTWYIAYVLVRFPRSAIIDAVSKVDSSRLNDAIVREVEKETRTRVSAEEKAELLRMINDAKGATIEAIAEGEESF
jgi:hypothetical protein